MDAGCWQKLKGYMVSINILSELDEMLTQGKQFRSAVLLTYSLNLQFFEQLVQPRLDALGCAHVLIISDAFGYQESIDRNLHQLNGVGRRYMCAALHSNRRGVLHSKLLMLASEKQGWMIIGSGNLTFHGYGQNLELFDQFIFEQTEDETYDSDDAYPFQVVWQLVEKLQPTMSTTTQAHVGRIRQSASWLSRTPRPRLGIAVWHSYDGPLLDRLRRLTSVDEIQLIAPFIDTSIVEQLLYHFAPKKLLLSVNAAHPNVDARQISKVCKLTDCEFQLLAIEAADAASTRGLHAKALVGIHKSGSWCVSGSANMTRPALADHWRGQGNLELVVYRSSSDTRAFDPMWKDGIVSTHSISVNDYRVADEISKELDSSPKLILHELIERNGFIEGTIEFEEESQFQEIWLEMVLSDEVFCVVHNSDGSFVIQLSDTLQVPNAGRICARRADDEIICSAKVFIDQPYELERYGARAFYRSMRGKLEMVRDAAHTFRELMEYLFSRVNRESIKEEDVRRRSSISERKRRFTNADAADQGEVLPESAFVTDEELTYHIGRHIDELNPYDRDHYSLRDLLIVSCQVV